LWQLPSLTEEAGPDERRFRPLRLNPATLPGISESTVKKHGLEVFQQLSMETRTAASLQALEVPNGRRSPAG
jgi:hypothetical protein